MQETEKQTAVPTTEPADVTTATESVSQPPEQVNSQDLSEALTVKFNKQEYQLSKEDAVNYAQLGMKFQSVQPLFDKLKTLAARSGQTLTEFVETLGGEPADPNERLAREFCELQAECPELEQFEDLPETVIQQAVEHGTPLTLAYLRYCYGEHTRIRHAQQTAAQAALASAGPQRGEPQGVPDPAVEAMLKGVWCT